MTMEIAAYIFFVLLMLSAFAVGSFLEKHEESR
jgi:hypothetical protein